MTEEAQISGEEQPSQGMDPVSRRLAIALLVMVVLVLSVLMYVAASGVIFNRVPRTMVERQLRVLQNVAEERPTVAAAWADWARAALSARQFGLAEEILDNGTAAVGDDAPELLLERGRLEWMRGDTAKAVALLTRAQDSAAQVRYQEMEELKRRGISPDSRVVKGDVRESAALLQGDILAQDQQWDAALKAYSTAIRENDLNADSHVRRGFVLLELKKPEPARAEFERALQLVPDATNAAEGLARAKEQLGQ